MCPNEPTGARDAGQTFLTDLAEPAVEAGAIIRDAMRQTADTIEDTLVKATRTGRLSFSDMARSIVADLSRIAIRQFITQPLTNVLTNVLSSVFGGARADGGPVDMGRAYLVGERGPELFVPGASGAIQPNGAGGGNITLNVQTRDAESFRRSEAQIAAIMQRLAARGQRNG
jgi:phage-related minor tail protein